jgi:glyoxylase-like metal-dependent hydrolase (beta-lactamase superfamily II)/rhodanese-related sulfurtransferase
MKVEQIYTSCLAEAAYYIESKGEAAVIDPLRETKPYIDRIESDGAKLKYVFETHFHADFVSGHLDLAKKTGAEIVFGPTASPDYKAHIAYDEEEFVLGDVRIKVLHTPGHTMESSTFLLIDEKGNDYAIFSGDTLFIGDVGRPDLAVKSNLSREDLASHLHDSLRDKILPLSDDIIIYPGHGAGSACGKKMSEQTIDTLGNQKMFNYALRQDMSRDEFIKEVTEGLVAPPQYFPKNAVINKTGYESFEDVMKRGVVALDPDEFEDVVNRNNAIIIDTRDQEEFKKAFIPNSIYIGLDGRFASWVGTLIPDLKQPIVFVANKGDEEEVVTRLARVGYDNALGYLKGGFKVWVDDSRDVDAIRQVSAEEFASLYSSNIYMNILDVRKESEFNSEHIVKAGNTALDFVNEQMDKLSRDKDYYVYCETGYRSVTFISILQARGHKNLIDLTGGIEKIKDTSVPRTEFVEASTML